MKRNTILVIMLCVLLLSSATYAVEPIRILLNSTEITSGTPVQIINGVPMIPMDLVDDRVYGVNVTWNSETNTLSINDLKDAMPRSARSVIDYWVSVRYCKTSKLYPRVDGPDDFKQAVTAAFELLQQKAPDAFASVTSYIDNVILTDCDAGAVVNVKTGQLKFDKDYYELLDNYDYRIQEIAAVLVHEACHVQLCACGLDFMALDNVASALTYDDTEAIATMTQYHVVEKLGADPKYLKLCKNWLKDYVEKL